ncbi:7-deoxyloganetin glucosyltransferase [Linum grandiflorum]
MLHVAKILHSRGFHVTFVNTEYNHKRLLKNRGTTFFDFLPPDFNFDAIPDGLKSSSDGDNSNIDATQDIPSLCNTTAKNCLVPFRDLILRLNNDAVSPVVKCIVSDNSMTFTLDVAKEFGIPNVLFAVPGASGLLGYHSFPLLVQRDSSCMTNGYLETVVDFIPGLNKNIRLKDLPTFLRTADPNDMMLNYVLETNPRIYEGSAVLLNTFDPLEHECLAVLSTAFPNVLTIGPLNLLIHEQATKEDKSLKNLNTSLWTEQPYCLDWLDSKEPNSVLYVNFGSITVLSPDQLKEFAWGLAKSGKPFLWVVRPDLVEGDSAIMPSEFLEETKDRGMLVGWCAQEQVLKHPSVGGFLSHMGWNSTLESLSYGVPMICWPFFADQQTSCFYACEEWGVGMEIDPEVKRGEVGNLVKELMDGEKGKEMQRKAMEWKLKAEEATQPGGSSFRNVERLVEILLNKKSS